MIVKEVLEVTLHLESFRNIELYYQGLYLVKLNIYDAPNGLDKVLAMHNCRPWCMHIPMPTPRTTTPTNSSKTRYMMCRCFAQPSYRTPLHRSIQNHS